MAPNQEDLKKLIADGYTLADLAKLSPQELSTAIARSRSGSILGGTIRDPFTQRPIASPDAFGRSKATQQRQPGTSLNIPLLNVLGSDKAKNIGKGLANIFQQGGKAIQSGVAKRLETTSGTSRRAPANTSGGSLDDGALGDFVPEEFQQPNFEYRDFMDRAQQQADSVYGPRFAAIDAAAQAAQSRYGRNDQLTKGLYDNLVSSIAQTAQDTSAKYQQAQQAQTQATQGLQQNIGDTYTAGQNQQAQLLQQLGQGEAAQDVLKRGTSDSSFNQSQAALQGNAQNAAIAQQGAGQTDYLTNIGNAERTQGVVSREALLAALSGQLGEYDQQRIGLSGDKAQAAYDINDKLSSRDMELQQANYGGYRDAYGARQDNSRFQLQLQQQAAEAEAAANRAAQEQSRWNAEFGLKESQYATDLATAQAKLRLDERALDSKSGNQGLDINDQDPVSKTIAQISNATGDDQQAQQYFAFVDQAVRGFGDDFGDIIANPVIFIEEVKNRAIAKGLNPLTAQRAAAAYWNNMAKPK